MPAPYTIPVGLNPSAIGVETTWWLDVARRAEDAGLATVWIWDHFISRGELDDPLLECWTMLAAAADRVLLQYGTTALQYGLSRGYGPLREFLAERVARRAGDSVTVDDVLITAGSQQGLDLIGRAFLEPGRYVSS